MSRMRTLSILLLSLGFAPLPVAAGHEMEDRNLLRGGGALSEQLRRLSRCEPRGTARLGRSRDPTGSFPRRPMTKPAIHGYHDNGLLFDYTRLGGQGRAAREMRGITGSPACGMPGLRGHVER